MNNFILSGETLAEGVALSWPTVANAVRYEVRRREPPNPNTVVGVPEKAIYFDEETFVGANYLYQISAILDGGGSLNSTLLEIQANGPRNTKRMTIGSTGIHRE